MTVLDDRLIEAMVQPARFRMSIWSRALNEHRGHATFRTEEWAFTREVGFTCSCSGEEQTWRISLTTLRDMLPVARDAYLRTRERFSTAERRIGWKARGLAEKKARRLLFKFLTREQKWTFRAGYFDVLGQNGKTYRIKQGSCQNVFLLENGKETTNYCIVPKNEWMPVCDLMLAQKLFLEFSIQSFLAIANVREPVTLEPVETRPPSVIDVTRADVENVEEWARARLAG